MKNYLTATLILSCLLSVTLAVSDENICDQTCQYCCRDKQCRSESDCKGNYQPFIILGAVAGGLIVLFIARRFYVHYRNKAMIARGEDPKAKKGTRLRWRSKRNRSPSKAKKEKEKEKREKKERPKKERPAKPKSLKEVDEKNKSKGDIYLQIDNESVLSHDDVKSTKNKSGATSSRNELKNGSKNEILTKADTNKNDKDRLNPYKQNKIPDMPDKSSKDKENKKDDKTRSSSKGKAASSNTKKAVTGSMKDSKVVGSMKDSKVGGNASTKERGRSKEPTSGQRSTSQKKATSSGPKGEKSRGNSAGPRRNQM